MKPERIFYQDFLFEDLPVDEQDNPKVDVIFSSKKDENAVNLSLDVLMRMNKSGEQQRMLFHQIIHVLLQVRLFRPDTAADSVTHGNIGGIFFLDSPVECFSI